MSQHDIQLVNAAHTALVLQCVDGNDQLDLAELKNVSQWLSSVDQPQQWLFGSWDAPYIATHGGPTTGSLPSSPPLGPYPLDQGKAVECVNDDQAVLNMTARSPMFGYTSPSPDTLSELTQYWGEGVARAEADPRFLSLAQQRGQCTQNHGYSVYYPHGDGVPFLSYNDNWTYEQRLQAELTEAQCSDDMSFTQQAVDMIATYQMQTISQHQAELVAIKQVLDQRVTDATKILTDLGLL